MSASGKITQSGKQLVMQLLRGEIGAQGLGWYALGDGDWIDRQQPPLEDELQTALAHEIVRKQITRTAFFQRDDLAGTLRLGDHLYKEVPFPTANVGFIVEFTRDEINGTVICEEAFFGGPILTAAQPLAYEDEVIEPGTLFWVRNRKPATKTPADLLRVIAILLYNPSFFSSAGGPGGGGPLPPASALVGFGVTATFTPNPVNLCGGYGHGPYGHCSYGH